MKITLQFLKPLLMAMFLSTTIALQAQVKISGKIKSSSDNEVLPGANVVIKGTTVGTVANFDGIYEITAKKGDILIFSFIGFLSKEVVVSNQSILNMTLTPNLVDMDEVIVVGYGTQKKADLTSSIAVLNPKELIKMPGGITEGLQGSVAGVNVSRGKIRIRGVGSLGDTDPLWVVDGLIGGQAPNENEIESIQILKDAASCAIYGARGANGVIIVTTKKGKKGEPKIEYHGYSGTKYPWKTLDLMNATQLSEYVNEAYYNAGTPENTPSVFLDPYHSLADTDWQSEWFRRGYYQNHNLSVSGGNESMTYRTGINYGKDQQTTVRSSSENLSMFLNSEFKKGRFTVGQTFVLSNYSNAYGGGTFTELLRTPSNLPVYDENEEYGYYITGTAETGNDMINQIGMKNLTDRTSENSNIKGTVYSTLDILEGLQYKINIGVDYFRAFSYNYDHVYDLGKGKNAEADLSETASRNNRIMLENTLSYTKKINHHNITALAGVTSEESKYRTMQAGGQGFLSTSLRTLENILSEQTVAGKASASAIYSLLGRVNYDFKGRYLFTANIRRDASSKFAKSNRWGTFPSASLGWRISDEAFMENIFWVNNLKLRVSYGLIGNQNMDDYSYENFVESANQFYTLGTDQSDVPAPLPKQFGNPSAKWETSYVTNLGLDLGVFDDKLTLTMEYYDKFTEDLLIKVPVPASSGSTEKVWLNAGELKNKGFEFSVTHRNTIGDLSYSISGNFATNTNQMLKIGNNNEPIAGGDVGIDYVTRTAVGSSVGRFYTLRTDGIFKTQEDIDNYFWEDPETGNQTPIQPNASVGDVKFRDLNNDGKINEDDYDWAGSPIPKLSYGFNISLDYRGFDFSMFWQGDYGQSIFNRGIGLYGHGTSSVNQSTSLVDRFRAEDLTITNYDADGNVIAEIFYPSNINSDIPRVVQGDPNGNFSKMSDMYIEDGSYLRLKRLTLGYTIPESLSSKFKVDKLRFYIGGKNLITITDYSNFDPEVAGLEGNREANLNRGIDMQQSWAASNITTREFFFGVQLNF